MKVNEMNKIKKGAVEPDSVTAILAAPYSGYALDIFTAKEVAALQIFKKRGKNYLKCFATDRDRIFSFHPYSHVD